MVALFSKKDPIESFWNWFQENEGTLFKIDAADPSTLRIFSGIDKNLGKVSKGVSYEFSPISDDGKREFVISAGGLKENFADVEKLHDAAPDLPRWDFIKYRQPKPGMIEEFKIGLGDFVLSTDNLWFSSKENNGLVDVTLYIEKISSEMEAMMLGQHLFLLLDASIGEYNVATKCGELDFQPAPENPEAEGLHPFKDFADKF